VQPRSFQHITAAHLWLGEQRLDQRQARHHRVPAGPGMFHSNSAVLCACTSRRVCILGWCIPRSCDMAIAAAVAAVCRAGRQARLGCTSLPWHFVARADLVLCALSLVCHLATLAGVLCVAHIREWDDGRANTPACSASIPLYPRSHLPAPTVLRGRTARHSHGQRRCGL
jgi:hypothetical protein